MYLPIPPEDDHFDPVYDDLGLDPVDSILVNDEHLFVPYDLDLCLLPDFLSWK